MFYYISLRFKMFVFLFACADDDDGGADDELIPDTASIDGQLPFQPSTLPSYLLLLLSPVFVFSPIFCSGCSMHSTL